nr:tetratricopeptide repeat protein [Chloroflexia bacterium]
MDEGTFNQLLGQAQGLIAEGRYDEALPLAELAAELAKAVGMQDHSAVAAAYNSLAEVHRNLGDPAAAEPLYLQAIEIIRSELGEESEAHGVVLTNLALARYQRGDPAGARPAAEQALDILVGLHGPSHAAVENNLRLLAAIHSALGDAQGAVAFRVREVDSATARLGRAHPDVMRLVNEVAVLANEAGAVDVAERLCEQYLEGARVEMAGTLDLAVALENLAQVYTQRWRQVDARELLGEALGIRRNVQGDEHPDVTDALERRALTLQAGDDSGAAVPLFEELLERRRAVGDEAEFARTLNNLGAAYLGAFRLSEAREKFEAALAITRRIRGDRHPDAARSLQSLANVDQMLGDHGRAETQLVDAVAIFRAAGDAYRADAAVALINLAELYLATDRQGAAQHAFGQVVDLRLAVFGPDHPATADAERRLAGALHAAGQDAEAISLLERAVAGVQATLGANHPTYFKYRRDLANLLRSDGQPQRGRAILERDLPRLEGEPLIRALEDLASMDADAGEVVAAQTRLSEVVEIFDRTGDARGRANVLDRLAELDLARGDAATALARRQEVVAVLRAVEQPTSRSLAVAMSALADALATVGEDAQALALYREAIAIHEQAGRYADAVPAGILVLELTRAAAEADPTAVAMDANNLAELYRRAGQPAQAVPLLVEASELLSRKPDPDALTVGMVLNNLGLAQSASGEYELARQALDEALRLFRAQPEPSDGLAFALNNLAQTLVELGEYAAADDLLEESLAVRREIHGPKSAVYATALLNRGMILLRRGELSEAKSMLEEALAIIRSQRGDGHPDAAVALNALGHLHRRLGRYADAETLLRWALSLQQETMGPDDPRLAYTLDNLAGVLHLRGDVANADLLFRQAAGLLTAHAGPVTNDLATVLNNHCQLLLEVGRIGEADKLLSRALAVAEAGRDDVRTATVATNLGLVRMRTGEPSAVPLLERALALRRGALGKDNNPDVAQSLNNVAVAIQTSDPERARALLEQALAIRKRVFGDDHPDVAESANNLSFVCGDEPRAAELLEEAVRIRRATNDGPALADTLTSLALAYVRLDRGADAVALYREAAEVRDRLIARAAALSSEHERLAYLAPIRVDLSLFLTVVRARLADRPDAVRLACDLVLRRKGVVAEGVASQRAAVLGGLYPSLRGQLAELDGLRSRISRLTLGPSSADPGVTAEVTKLQDRYDDLDIALARQVPE